MLCNIKPKIQFKSSSYQKLSVGDVDMQLHNKMCQSRGILPPKYEILLAERKFGVSESDLNMWFKKVG